MELFELLKELEVSAKASALLVSLFWDVISFVGWAVGAGAAVILGLLGWLWRRIETLNKESKADIKSDIGRVEDLVKDTESGLKADIGRVEGLVKDTESGLKADIGRVEGLVKDTESRLTYRINRLEGDVSSLIWDFTQSQKTAAPTASTSPITLTEVGENIAKAVNARAMADKYVDKVEIPENADRFEIQEACFQFAMGKLRDLISRDEQHLINEAVFMGVAAKSHMVYMVLGVLLRDYHLEKRGFDVPVRKPKGEQTPPPQQQPPQSHPPA